MGTLQIRKLQSGAFEHVDSIDGNFFLGRFSFKQEFNKAFLVEAYGAKRREYTILEISVFDYLGTEETFTNFTDLINRLTNLGYNGIETNGLIPSNVETTTNKTTDIVGSETSILKYPNIKAVVDWVTSLFVPKTRTLTIGSETFDLSANRTFAGGGSSEEFQYMNFYISSNVPYNANPTIEQFPNREIKNFGALLYNGNTWDNVTSTAGDYRGTSQSVFKSCNLVEVIVNSVSVSADVQIRVVAFDVASGGGGAVTNPRSLAVKTLTGLGSLRTNIFSSGDINSTNVINTNTMITITATVKSGVTLATINDRFHISLKFKNI